MGQHHRISPTSSSKRLISGPGDPFVPLPHGRWMSIVRRTRLSTDGDRAFPVIATWNSLPQHVTSAPSMSVFRGRLKAFLFNRSFPWLFTAIFVMPVQWQLSFSDTLIVLFYFTNRQTNRLTHRRSRRRFRKDLGPLRRSSFPVDLWAGEGETQLS